MRILKIALWCFLPFKSPVLIWAVPSKGPQTDDPGVSQSGNSLDEKIVIISRALKTRPIYGDFLARTLKGTTTQGVCQYLSSEYPNKNVLIYHNQSSVFNGINTVHRSIQFPQLTSSGNEVYELEVFDSGTFELVGESGYHNWAFCGSDWVQNGSSVVFRLNKDHSLLAEQLRKSATTTSSSKLGGGYIQIPEKSTDASAEIQSIYSDGGSTGSSNGWSIEVDPGGSAEASYVSGDSGSEGYFDAVDLELASVDDIAIESATVSTAGGPIGIAIGLVVIAAVVLVTVALIFSKDFKAIFKQHQTERAYTQSVAIIHYAADESRNIVVFHNQDTEIELFNSVHYHHELDLGFESRTQGYEIYSFDFGTVTLAGDGGYENWAFAGNWYREPHSAYVQFFPRSIGIRSLLEKTRSKTGKPIKRRAAIPLQEPLRSDPEAKHGYYFVDCLQPDNSLSLGIAYYKEIYPGGGNVAKAPDDFVEVVSNHAGKQVWQGEGDTTFSNGTMFHWSFIYYGWNVKDQVAAGMAETPFEQLWVYREAGEFLFNTAANWSCSSLYYAL